jgi:hypothetical protein
MVGGNYELQITNYGLRITRWATNRKSSYFVLRNFPGIIFSVFTETPFMQQKRTDIADSERDEQYLKSEEATIDLPDVKDIPGQEHIHVPKMKEFIDTTISSDDEEGVGVFDDDTSDADADVTDEEKELLDRSTDSMAGEDDEDRRKSMLDNKDEDGDPLNENVEVSGDDLDVPGAGDDDDNEEIGEEDEENNSYSLGGDRKD